MRRVSHFVRTAFCFAFFALGGGVLSWIVLPVVRLLTRDHDLSVRRCQRTLQRGFQFFLWVLRTLRLVRTSWSPWASCKVERPCVIICNHPCLLDTVMMVARYDNVVCLVKQSYYDSPFFNGLARACGFIPAGRGHIEEHAHMLEQAADRLRRGYSILAFPEGRRSPLVGSLAFGRGAFEIAARANVPVIPVRIVVEPRILVREEPIHRMPATCASYTAEELPTRFVPAGRNDVKRSIREIQALVQPFVAAAEPAATPR